VPTPIDPTSLGFLLAENRNQPMHVAGLQLFEKPADAGADFARQVFESALEVEDIAPLFKKRPYFSIGTLGQWVWTEDKDFDVEHHVRHNALPQPGRVRELLELVSRLHGTMLARERPLWECHIIEGLADGRVANNRAAAGRNPYDKDLTDLVGELSTRSEEFRTRWARHDVKYHRTGRKVVHHPIVGDLDLAFEAFELPGEPGLRVNVYTADPGTPSEDALKLLASWAATQTDADAAKPAPDTLPR